MRLWLLLIFPFVLVFRGRSLHLITSRQGIHIQLAHSLHTLLGQEHGILC